MFLVNLYILINLPFCVFRLIEVIKEYKRLFQKKKIVIKDKIYNWKDEV